MKKRRRGTEAVTQNAGTRQYLSSNGDVLTCGEMLMAGKLKKCAFCLLLLLTFHFSFFTAASADEIKSRSAVVMDSLTGRILYAKNPNLRLMPASTTKLMTALVVVEKARLGDVVTVSKKAAGTAPTKAGFKDGDKVTIETLLYAALMKSANDAAVALAEGVGGTEEQFVKMMNMKAMAIGAYDTKFINANGLPGKGQYITAYDLSKIMRQAIKYPVLKEILGTRLTEVSTETGKTIAIKNTNKLLWSDEELLGGKTGYTRQARHCFVCAGERDNETIIVALLGAPSRDFLWKESEVLMTYGSKVIGNQKEPFVYLTENDVVYLTKSGSEDIDVKRTSLAAADNIAAAQPKYKKVKAKKRVLLAANKKIIKKSAKRKSGKSGILLAKASSKNGAKQTIKTSAKRKGGKSGVVLAKASSKHGAKQMIKKKKSAKMMAKVKKARKQRLAKREEYGAKG